MSELSPSLLNAVSDFVAANLGLHFGEERYPDLERGLVSAACDLGRPDAAEMATHLLSDSLTHTDIEVLASHLTIGETYFFREEQSLRFFAEEIVPGILRGRHDGGRPLRIWSAGCCTGEEPYSLAIFLDRFLPGVAGSKISILATDINAKFLRKAVDGVYGEWSFRSMPAEIRDRYFKKTSHRRWDLDPRIRKMVTFSHLNLAGDFYPSLVNDTNAMDVIFCRNVLMYFSAERTKSVAQKFHDALAPGGWLFVGVTEASNAAFSTFRAVPFVGGTVYQKAGVVPLATAPQERPVVAPLRPAPPVIIEPVVQPASRVQEPEKLKSDQHPDVVDIISDPDDFAARARRAANLGDLPDAKLWCERAIASDRLNPAHYYLLSAIQRELGQLDDAIRSLERSLYLDPGFVIAHFGLAGIERARDRREVARRHLGNALIALRTYASDDVLPESDGLTAGRFAEIIVSLLGTIPGSPTAAGRGTR